jgi:LDH2 family malate/lactate/ureidoglycolate dehydrogenase
MSVDAAERYYESFGKNWERAAFIKARVVAGDHEAGEAFLDRMAVLTGAMLGQDGVRLPGSSRLAKREAAAQDGIAVSEALMEELQGLAG